MPSRPSRTTKGQTENAVTVALTQFERDHLGRGPRDARTFILQDVVLVRLAGILTPAEVNLVTEEGGAELVKRMRSRLVESSRELIEKIVEEITGAKMISMHTDLSTRTGERVFVFVMDRSLEER